MTTTQPSRFTEDHFAKLPAEAIDLILDCLPAVALQPCLLVSWYFRDLTTDNIKRRTSQTRFYPVQYKHQAGHFPVNLKYKKNNVLAMFDDTIMLDPYAKNYSATSITQSHTLLHEKKWWILTPNEFWRIFRTSAITNANVFGTWIETDCRGTLGTKIYKLDFNSYRQMLIDQRNDAIRALTATETRKRMMAEQSYELAKKRSALM